MAKFLLNFAKILPMRNGGDKVLLLPTGGIGDNAMAISVYQKCKEMYGDNLYILGGNKEIADYLEIKYLKRNLKNTYKIFRTKYGKIIDLCTWREHKYINYLNGKEIIGYDELKKEDKNYSWFEKNKLQYKTKKNYTKIITGENYEYMVDHYKHYYEELFHEKSKEIKINRKKLEKKDINNVIAIGLYSAGEEKNYPNEKWCEIFKYILKNYSKADIYLMGKGTKDFDVAESIVNFLKDSRIKNKVDKYTLTETINVLLHSKLFIGIDSSLYNIAYILRKKNICILSQIDGKRFEHTKYCKIIKSPEMSCARCKGHCIREINGECVKKIPVEQIIQAIEDYNIDEVGNNL